MDKDTAKKIIKAMATPQRSGISRRSSFLSKNGQVGGSFELSENNDLGGYIQLDYELGDMDCEKTYEFEPDEKPRNWQETFRLTRIELKRIIDDIWEES